jgi:hypothetical protein
VKPQVSRRFRGVLPGCGKRGDRTRPTDRPTAIGHDLLLGQLTPPRELFSSVVDRAAGLGPLTRPGGSSRSPGAVGLPQGFVGFPQGCIGSPQGCIGSPCATRRQLSAVGSRLSGVSSHLVDVGLLLSDAGALIGALSRRGGEGKQNDPNTDNDREQISRAMLETCRSAGKGASEGGCTFPVNGL